MNWIKKLLYSRAKNILIKEITFPDETSIIEPNEVYLAWSSGNLERMLKASNLKTNSIDRHFLLQEIVQITYKNRYQQNSRELCEKYCSIYLAEFEREIGPKLKSEFKGNLPRISVFQHYSTLLVESGRFNLAINICKIAIKWEVRDGTKGGFLGRIKRIEKTMNSSLYNKF